MSSGIRSAGTRPNQAIVLSSPSTRDSVRPQVEALHKIVKAVPLGEDLLSWGEGESERILLPEDKFEAEELWNKDLRPYDLHLRTIGFGFSNEVLMSRY